jgi:hypothetical protein
LQRHDGADQSLCQPAALDLQRYLVERLHRELIAGERRASRSDKLAPEAVPRSQQEKRDEHDDSGLSGHSHSRQ